MLKPDIVITLADGKKYITTKTAATLLNVAQRRVRQILESGALSSVQLEEFGTHYIPLDEFEIFAKQPRKVGRPVKEKPQANSTKTRKK